MDVRIETMRLDMRDEIRDMRRNDRGMTKVLRLGFRVNCGCLLELDLQRINRSRFGSALGKSFKGNSRESFIGSS